MHRDAAAAWTLRHQEALVESATLRERAASAEKRVADLASQLQRHQAQSEREITQLRDNRAATASALLQLEGRHEEHQKERAAVAGFIQVSTLKADSQAGRSGDRPIADEMDARTLDARAPRQSVRHPAD
ncbi:MAG: hypothetical protein EOP82_28625 [Variovorax sp.]|nr:MAG: hypothetical protein EOP82_28625 [Variovorax sp.]